MRIKKKNIRETSSDNVNKSIQATKDLISQTATEFENIGMDKPDAAKSAVAVVTPSLGGEDDDNKLEETDDSVSDSELGPHNVTPNNDWDGEYGEESPDYGQEPNTTSLSGADFKDDLSFESVNDKMLEGDDNLHSRIQALKVQIDRTKDPKKLVSLKDWLGKMEEEELAASKANKTNESVNGTSVEAYSLHRMANNVGQEVAAEFLSNHKVNLELLTKAIQQRTIDKYELRDVINGDAQSSKLNKFMKEFVNESINPKMTKKQLNEVVLGKKEKQVIKTFKVKDLRK